MQVLKKIGDIRFRYLWFELQRVTRNELLCSDSPLKAEGEKREINIGERLLP